MCFNIRTRSGASQERIVLPALAIAWSGPELRGWSRALIADGEALDGGQRRLAALATFRSDLSGVSRFYEVMRQAIDFDDADLEALSALGRNP